MATKTTIDATTISNFSSTLNSAGDELERLINNLETQLEIFGTGDGDKAYWSGVRALKWFGNSYTNIANDTKVASLIDQVIVQLNEYAISAKEADDSASSAEVTSLQKQLKKALARQEKLLKKVEKLKAKATSATAKANKS